MAGQPIRIIRVDTDRILASSTPGFVQFPFVLSGTPDRYWVQFFRSAYSRLSMTSKRAVQVEVDRIVVDLHPQDDKQHALNLVKRAVNEANQQVEQALSDSREQEARVEQTRKATEEDVKRLREEASGLDFS